MCSKKLGLHGKKNKKVTKRAARRKIEDKKSTKQKEERMTEAEWYFLMNEDILN